ncbi:HAMP domain-containing sensor histidine kinase [Paradesulfitobacterium aromaticivorans]
MNLKRRLVLANAATVIIPAMITVVVALAFVFVFGTVSDTNISLANYQRLSEIKLELIESGNSILKQKPEAVEEVSFQQHLQEQLAAINGELVIIKDEEVLFSSRNFSKIDLAKFALEGNKKWGKEAVVVGSLAYTVEAINLKFQDGGQGNVLLLAPVDRSLSSFTGLLILVGVVFVLAFAAANILVSYQLSRAILKPLNNLQQAAAEISRGNLECEIVEEGDKEIRALCRDLELMRIKLKDSIRAQLKYEDNRKVLVSSISHDLKTPVTSIKGYVEGIFDGVANTPEKMDRYLRTIYAKAEQVDIMIDDLLLYSKLDLNQIPFNFERIEIVEFLQGCLLESEPELERNHIKTVFQKEIDSERTVLLDRDRMKRVIINILDNSRKYMNKEQGEIKMIVRETLTSIIIEVRDNGSGIREQDLPHIFDRFYRSDTARTEIKGSGLGLAIAKQIIEGHSGRIWVVSHGGAGTSIMISLSRM